MIANINNIWVWVSFSVFIVAALTVDALALGKMKRPNESMVAAIVWTIVWFGLALLFNLGLWLYLYTTTSATIAHQKSLEFLTGYLIEESLSLDNLFAFYMVFKHLRIPIKYQQRVFSIGIWSAIVLRLLFILLGAWLVQRFHWVLFLMGGFLFVTGMRMLLVPEKHTDVTEKSIFTFVKRLFRYTPEIKGNHFFIRQNNLWYVTPLFLALIFIELSDIIFALDSIPAIFAITTDPFIVWSSNIFAILGLRALYFLLAGMVTRFHLLQYGVAILLIFVGAKMLIEPWIQISVLLSLLVIMMVLGVFVILSIWQSKSQKQE